MKLATYRRGDQISKHIGEGQKPGFSPLEKWIIDMEREKTRNADIGINSCFNICINIEINVNMCIQIHRSSPVRGSGSDDILNILTHRNQGSLENG
jgi:hypothetical protein